MASKKRKSPKSKLMTLIRTKQAQASMYRLAGFIPNAIEHEQVVDRLVSEAEKNGWADSALLAEERGVSDAHRYRRSKEFLSQQ